MTKGGGNLTQETLNRRQCVDILTQVEQSRYNEIAARNRVVRTSVQPLQGDHHEPQR